MADKRLIDANSAKLAASDYKIFRCQLGGLMDVAEFIDDQPTVYAVELPCKIGEKVYRIDDGNYSSDWKPFVQELTVTEISWKKEKYGDKDLGFAIIANGIRYKFTAIGKSVFMTRKEAEAKLGGDGNG